MQLKFIFPLLACLLIMAACQLDNSGTKKKVAYDAIAQELCKCAQPSILLQQEMTTLSKAKKKEELKALFPKAGKTFDKVVECSKDYMFTKNTDGLETDKLKAELMKQCEGMPHKMAADMMLKL